MFKKLTLGNTYYVTSDTKIVVVQPKKNEADFYSVIVKIDKETEYSSFNTEKEAIEYRDVLLAKIDKMLLG